MLERRLTIRVDEKEKIAIERIAFRNDISEAEVCRRAIKFAMSWRKRGFWSRVRKCFFSF